MLAAGVALLVAFVAYERRRRESPLIEPSLLRNRTYVAGIAVGLALFATFAGLILTSRCSASSARASRRSTPA